MEHSKLKATDSKCERLLIGRVDGSVALLELDVQKQDCLELPNCSLPYCNYNFAFESISEVHTFPTFAFYNFYLLQHILQICNL